jgi:pyruvate dehydrogenase E1 component beta subunit
MPTPILMPALSPTMEVGTLAKWHVKEGDRVSSGDVIAEIETDKATMEVEAADEGVVGRIVISAGTENVPVNEVIALLLSDDEDESALDTPSRSAAASKPVAPKPAASKPSAAAPSDEMTEKRSAKAEKPEPTASDTASPEIPVGTKMKVQTMREALRDAMAEEMRRDENVFVLGEEVAEYEGAYKVTQGLLKEFGSRRVIDTPITEHGFAGLGVGAAFSGLKPVVEFMTFNFAMQAIDHIINSAAKTLYMSGGQMRTPIVFRGPNGYAPRVGAQHAQCYASWYAHVPGLKVIAPFSPADAKGLLKAAIRDPNPVIFLENELLYGRSGEVPVLDDFILPIGKARIAREGTDVTLVSFGHSMLAVLDAAEKLAVENISAEVVDLRTLRPLDQDSILASLRKTNRLVTVEDGWAYAGIGAEIAARVMAQAFDDLDAPVMRVTGTDVPLPYAANLEKLALPAAADIVKAAKSVLYIE